jgi:hypothetical protein
MKWLHRLLHPHCDECHYDSECKSCEILKQQLAIANEEKRQLLSLVIAANQPEQEVTHQPTPELVRPKHIPWKVQRQMLEAEDREAARLMREAQVRAAGLNVTVGGQQSIEELEKELGVAKE